jgi:hypothetical protein
MAAAPLDAGRPVDRSDQAACTIEAHEALVEADPENFARFKPGRAFEPLLGQNVPEADKSTSRDRFSTVEHADEDCEQGMQP